MRAAGLCSRRGAPLRVLPGSPVLTAVSAAAAYQRVMTEGLGEDVLHFIDVDQVVDMWDELHLSPHIRAPWERWLLDSDPRVRSAAEEAIRRPGEAPRRLGD